LEPPARLKTAETALEKGEYNKCLALLEELVRSNNLSNKTSRKVKLLMVTAYTGKGENEKAILICQDILTDKNLDDRQQIKQLLSILKAPNLTRPEDWSVKIPRIGPDSLDTRSACYNKKPRPQSDTQMPRTGPTKGLGLGFTAVTIGIFLVITILLSGCVRFTTDIQLTGPDQMKIKLDVESNSNQLVPWQKQFKESLQESEPKVNIESDGKGKQVITTASINSNEANLMLQKTIASATKTAGLDLPPPKITLKEKNWLIGIRQKLNISVDLRALPKIPGLTLSVNINSSPNEAALTDGYHPATIARDTLNLELKQGLLNELEFQHWYWSRLGIGVVLVVLLLSLVTVLQSIKVKMGFGFPELPP